MSAKEVFIRHEDVEEKAIPCECFERTPHGWVRMWENGGLLYWSKKDANKYDISDYGPYVQKA